MFMVQSLWQATSRVHPVNMMNIEWCRAAANPQPRPNNPGCDSARRLPEATQHLLADTHLTIPWRVKGWVDLVTAVRVCSPCPRLYTLVVFTKNMQLPTAGFEPWSFHTAVRHVTARPLRPATVVAELFAGQMPFPSSRRQCHSSEKRFHITAEWQYTRYSHVTCRPHNGWVHLSIRKETNTIVNTFS